MPYPLHREYRVLEFFHVLRRAERYDHFWCMTGEKKAV
jgi:hypothetical protein